MDNKKLKQKIESLKEENKKLDEYLLQLDKKWKEKTDTNK